MTVMLFKTHYFSLDTASNRRPSLHHVFSTSFIVRETSLNYQSDSVTPWFPVLTGACEALDSWASCLTSPYLPKHSSLSCIFFFLLLPKRRDFESLVVFNHWISLAFLILSFPIAHPHLIYSQFPCIFSNFQPRGAHSVYIFFSVASLSLSYIS